MKKLLIIFALLAIVMPMSAQDSDLFVHRRVNLFDIASMPGDNGGAHRDSIANNRIWRCEQPRLYVYQPGAEERKPAAVIVIPGGGYVKQAYETAGVSFAKWLNTFGITAFVLLHRLPNQEDIDDPSLAPLIDAQRAVKYVRAHAGEYGIDPDKIGVMGCSAGGHVCSLVSVVKDDYSRCGDALDEVSHRPDFAVLVSPVSYISTIGPTWKTKLSEANALMAKFPIDTLITADTPPMLMIHASDDRTVSAAGSAAIYRALLEAGIKESSLHIFPHGGHSIALRDQPGSTALWPAIAEAWIREILDF